MKILLIDNHTLFREGLRHILQQLPGGVDEILDAGSFREGLALAGQHPDLNLMLLEIKSPGAEGAISVKFFRQRYPHIPVVVVSGEEDCHLISKTLNYGASGFVCKSSTVPALLNALELALSGSIYVPPQLLRQHGMAVVHKDEYNGKRRPNVNGHGLTARQMEVLKYLAAGLSNKEIASMTELSEGTVKVHVAAVYQILRVNNRLEAVRAARQLGLAGILDGATGLSKAS